MAAEAAPAFHAGAPEARSREFSVTRTPNGFTHMTARGRASRKSRKSDLNVPASVQAFGNVFSAPVLCQAMKSQRARSPFASTSPRLSHHALHAMWALAYGAPVSSRARFTQTALP